MIKTTPIKKNEAELPMNQTTPAPAPAPAVANTPWEDYRNFLNEVGNVSADRVNPAFKSRYASLAEIIETIKPILAKHNLAVEQDAYSGENKMVYVVTSFRHKSGDVFHKKPLGYSVEHITNPQHIGGVLTYLRRQHLCTACVIAVDLDDDGNAVAGLGAGPTLPNVKTIINSGSTTKPIFPPRE